MIVIVCGGRNFRNNDLVFRAMNTIHRNFEITALVHGDAKGADAVADIWASWHPTMGRFPRPADWDTHGKRAGPIRNSEMITEFDPDLIIAFPGGSGTENMKQLGRQHDIMVIEVNEDKEGELLLKEF